MASRADGEEVRPIASSFLSDFDREEVLNTVFKMFFMSFEFSSLLLKAGNPSKSSILRSTSLLKVFIDTLLADYLISIDEYFSYLLSNFGGRVMLVTGIYFGMPCLGFIKSWLIICSKVHRLERSTTKILRRRSFASFSLKYSGNSKLAFDILS